MSYMIFDYFLFMKLKFTSNTLNGIAYYYTEQECQSLNKPVM